MCLLSLKNTPLRLCIEVVDWWFEVQLASNNVFEVIYTVSFFLRLILPSRSRYKWVVEVTRPSGPTLSSLPSIINTGSATVTEIAGMATRFPV